MNELDIHLFGSGYVYAVGAGDLRYGTNAGLAEALRSIRDEWNASLSSYAITVRAFDTNGARIIRLLTEEDIVMILLGKDPRTI